MKKPNRRPNTTCDYCDKPIYRRPNVLKTNKSKCCSHTCSNLLYSKEISERMKKNNPLPVMYGKDNPAWKGGITMFKKKGNYKYVKYVRCPQEFIGMARKDGYIMEHRLVMAKWVGRLLDRKEVVHHINHDPNDNRKSNLLLFPCNSSHKRFEGYENHGNGDKLEGVNNRID